MITNCKKYVKYSKSPFDSVVFIYIVITTINMETPLKNIYIYFILCDYVIKFNLLLLILLDIRY